MPRTEKQKIGDLGEGITCNYLKNKGYSIIETNYWKPWGEIDIIAQKRGVLHFVEVKSTTNNAELTRNYTEQTQKNVIRETQHNRKNSFMNNIFTKLRAKKGKVSRETENSNKTKSVDVGRLQTGNEKVSRITSNKKSKEKKIFDEHRPEDNLHPYKLKRLSRVIQTYLTQKDPNSQLNWQFDVAIVEVSLKNKQVRVKYMENIVLEENPTEF